MRKLTALATLSLGGALLWLGVANAQFGRGGGWTANGADAQRSSWIRTDPKISPESLQKPGFQVLWKIKLNNQAVQLNSLTPAMTLEGYIGYRGFRTLAHLGGSSNNIFAVDTDLGRLEWEKHITPGPVAAGTPACPGGITSEVSRPTGVAIPAIAPAGRGGGARGGARSGVGEPGEGAVTLAAARAAAAAAAGRGPNPGRGPGGGGRTTPNAVYSISGDGKLHSMLVSNGEDAEPSIEFVPANSAPHGLIVVDNVAYAATTEGCGSGGSALYALDLVSKQTTSFKPDSGAIAGSVGPAFAPDGSLFVATSNGQVVRLEAKTLAKKDWYSSNGGFVSSPVIFAHSDKTLLAVAAKDGSVHLLDTASLGGSDHGAPLVKSAATPNTPNLGPTALASWEASDGTRWILAPGAPAAGSGNGSGAIVAWKLVDQNGAPTLQQGWVSRSLVSPVTPIVINGVVFALSTGEVRSNDANLTAAERIKRSSPAVLYALDSATGKDVWNSGKAIASFVHGGGLSGGGTQVYLETYDGTLYAFGFYIEH